MHRTDKPPYNQGRNRPLQRPIIQKDMSQIHYTLVTSSVAYRIDGSSEMPFLIFSKIEVFQLSSFMIWSYSTTAAVNAS